MRRFLLALLVLGTSACSDISSPELSRNRDLPVPQLSAVGTPLVVTAATTSCALRASGSVFCWGEDTGGALVPPAGPITDITAGDYVICTLRGGNAQCSSLNPEWFTGLNAHTYIDIDAGGQDVCGVTTTNAIACVGVNDLGQHSSIPSGTFTQVSTGFYVSCALRTTGVVACWGPSLSGEYTAASGSFTQVSVLYNHACAVRSDGVVQCWGDNSDGRAPATKSAAVGSFTYVAVSFSYTCGLRTDGAVECWGAEAGVHTAAEGTFTHLDAYGHACAMNSAEFVECWGWSEGAEKSEQRARFTTSTPLNPALHDTWPVSAVSSSGLPVVITSVTPAICSFTDGVLKILKSGTCGIRGTVAGNANFLAAPQLLETIEAVGLMEPVSFAASPSGLHVNLTWVDVRSTRQTYYKVQRRIRNANGTFQPWQTIVQAAEDATSYVDTQTIAGLAYQYRVSSCNENGCTPPIASPAVAVGSPPVAPAITLASATSGASVQLIWTNVAGEQGYQIFRRENLTGTYGAWRLVATTLADVPTYNDVSVTEDARYQYRVQACNSAGCSPYSSEAKVLAQVKPGVPTGFTAALASADVVLSWTAASGNEDHFVVQRATSAGGVWSWSTIGTAPGGSAAYTDETPAPATPYRYRIRACNLAGCSAATANQGVTTP